MVFNSISDVKQYLQEIPKFQFDGSKAANFNLEKFRRFCHEIGNPQHNLKSIHVAGTNGKGSTCRLLASVYQKAGYKVGLYTSPHLIDFTERFVINGKQITEEELLRFFQKNEQEIHAGNLSYFELTTAIAFWWFANQKTDIAVIEAGLGGRLDATNIIEPIISVITSISFDHTDILGDSIEQIALEKAGIIKRGVPVVIGKLNTEAVNVIASVAAQKKAPLYYSSKLKPSFNAGLFTLDTDDGKINFDPGFRAPIQAYNIAVTWLVTKALEHRFKLENREIVDGINQAAQLYPNKGRFEKLSGEFDWFFDGAHNLEAVRAMKAMVAGMKPVRESILVLSIMKDKVNPDLIKEFSEFKKILYYSAETNRAAPVDLIRQHLPDSHEMPADKQLQTKLFQEFATELVIFAGSFYFYSTVRDWISTFAKNRSIIST